MSLGTPSPSTKVVVGGLVAEGWVMRLPVNMRDAE